MKQYLSFVLASSAALLAACGDQTTQPQSQIGAQTAAAASRDVAGGHPVGGVYVATNSASGNAVVAFARAESGTLQKLGDFATGGLGIGGGGDPLQSQGSVIISRDHQRLFVVNARSNSVSTFSIGSDATPHLVGTVSSFGSGPISLTLANERLYVLNQDNSVAGYSIAGSGLPTPLAQARISLGGASDGPSTINASRDGRFLFVTERAGSAIAVVAVDDRGNLESVSRRTSSGGGPFGFAVTSRDQLIVSEAGAGAVSSYQAAGGALSLITGSLSTKQAAPCWLVLSNDERFAFVANAGSGSIGGFAVSPNGVLTALNADGRTGVTNGSGATPLDLDITGDGKFLYVLQTGTGTVGAFAIGAQGSLTTLPDTPGLASVAGFQGLAAF